MTFTLQKNEIIEKNKIKKKKKEKEKRKKPQDGWINVLGLTILTKVL